MSFSANVKEELSRQIPTARHCRIAELAAAISLSGKVVETGGSKSIEIHTENVAVAKKIFTLLKKTFNINTDISTRRTEYPRKSNIYMLSVEEEDKVDEVLQSLKVVDEEGRDILCGNMVDGLLIQKTCCKRAFIRGAFLAAGSISDPEKSYHFEIACDTSSQAETLRNLINSFELDSKIIMRKNNYVVYIKESAQIVEILNVMEAHVALMELENIRILKDMRNSVNRKVNCETANLNKVVNAAVKQVEDIRLIESKMGLDKLSDSLAEIARLRLENPDVPLKELGAMLEPPVGKSGVNHRLRKIGEIADGLRG